LLFVLQLLFIFGANLYMNTGGKKTKFKAGEERSAILQARITVTAEKQLQYIMKFLKEKEAGGSKADAVEKAISIYYNQLLTTEQQRAEGAKRKIEVAKAGVLLKPGKPLPQIPKVALKKAEPGLNVFEGKIFLFNENGVCEKPEIVFTYDSKGVYYQISVAYYDHKWDYGHEYRIKRINEGCGGGGGLPSKSHAKYATKNEAIQAGCKLIRNFFEDKRKDNKYIREKDLTLVKEWYNKLTKNVGGNTDGHNNYAPILATYNYSDLIKLRHAFSDKMKALKIDSPEHKTVTEKFTCVVNEMHKRQRNLPKSIQSPDLPIKAKGVTEQEPMGLNENI